MGKEDLQSGYEDDPTNNQHVLMIEALAFIRPGIVANAFEKLVNYVEETLLPILGYVENMYIGRRL